MAFVLFARIGWMRWYRGPQPDDEKPVGGGKYNQKSVGHEAFNFLPLDDNMLGYFQPQLSKEHPSSIALERIGPAATGETLNDVMVIFVATDPKQGRQRIVGWYKSAAVHRHPRPSKDKKRSSFSYFIEASLKNAVLVPEKLREFIIPSGEGAFGRSNVCYLLQSNGKPKDKTKAQWMKGAVDYVNSYELENPAQEPGSEMDGSISDAVSITIDHAAGFQSNPRIRKQLKSMRWNALRNI